MLSDDDMPPAASEPGSSRGSHVEVNGKHNGHVGDSDESMSDEDDVPLVRVIYGFFACLPS